MGLHDRIKSGNGSGPGEANGEAPPIQLVGAGLILVAVVVAQTAPRPSGAPEPATPLEAEVGGSG